MKSLVEYFKKRGVIFRSLKPIAPKELGSRKRVSIHLGVDLKGYYVMVLEVEKRSPVLQKEARELMELHEKLERDINSAIKKKHILISAPLCAKAKNLLVNNSWIVDEIESGE